MNNKPQIHINNYPQLELSPDEFLETFLEEEISMHKFFLRRVYDAENYRPRDGEKQAYIGGKMYDYEFYKNGAKYFAFFSEPNNPQGFLFMSNDRWSEVRDSLNPCFVGEDPPIAYSAIVQEKTLVVSLKNRPLADVLYFLDQIAVLSFFCHLNTFLEDVQLLWDGNMDDFIMQSFCSHHCENVFVNDEGHIVLPGFGTRYSLSPEKMKWYTERGLQSKIDYLNGKNIGTFPHLFIGGSRNLFIGRSESLAGQELTKEIQEDIYYVNVKELFTTLARVVEGVRKQLVHIVPIQEHECLWTDNYVLGKWGSPVMDTVQKHTDEKFLVESQYYEILKEEYYIKKSVIHTKMRKHIFSLLPTENTMDFNYQPYFSKAAIEVSEEISCYFFNKESPYSDMNPLFELLHDPAIHCSLGIVTNMLPRGFSTMLKNVVFYSVINAVDIDPKKVSKAQAEKIDRAVTNFLSGIGRDYNIESMIKSLKSSKCVDKNNVVHRESDEFKFFETHWREFSKNLDHYYDIDSDEDVRLLRKKLVTWFTNISKQAKGYGALLLKLGAHNDDLSYSSEIDRQYFNLILEGLEKLAKRINAFAYKEFSYTGPNGKTYPFEYLYYFDPEVLRNVVYEAVPELYEANVENAVDTGIDSDISSQILSKDDEKKGFLAKQQKKFSKLAMEIWESEATIEEKSEKLRTLAESSIDRVYEKLDIEKHPENLQVFTKFYENLSRVLGDDVLIVL